MSAFDMLSSLSLTVSSFWFKVKDMWLLRSLEYSEDVAGLLNGRPSGLLCLREQGGLRRGGEKGEWLTVEQPAHMRLSVVCHLMWAWFMVPPNNYRGNIRNHWSHIAVKISPWWKSLRHCRSLQHVTQRHKVNKRCWKSGAGRLTQQGRHRLSVCEEKAIEWNVMKGGMVLFAKQ